MFNISETMLTRFARFCHRVENNVFSFRHKCICAHRSIHHIQQTESESKRIVFCHGNLLNKQHKVLKSKYFSTTQGMGVRHYEAKDHAQLYLQYRPTYSEAVYKTIINYYEDNKGPTCDYSLSVDIGCGNGQGTFPLANYFRRIVGTDVSAEQISNARHKENDKILFKIGKAEDLSFLEHDSVDLVTAAQAFHWFDHKAFFSEVNRVLKPGGVLAVYGYALPRVDNHEAQQLFLHYRYEFLKNYLDARVKEADNKYRTFELPYPGWKRVDDDDLAIRRTWPVSAYIGYLSSMASWRTYLKEHPDSDYLDCMQKRLLELYNTGTDGQARDINITWPVFMLLGRKPI